MLVRKMLPRSALALILPVLLAACAGSGEQIVSSRPPADPAVATALTGTSPLIDPGNGPFTASQISAIISGRSWRYEFGRIRGTVTYNADGSMNYNEEGKGAGTGKWWVGDYTLCETRYPTPFLPEGRNDDCGNFRKAGSHYYLGKAKLTLLGL
jgi:hypothetical protein